MYNETDKAAAVKRIQKYLLYTLIVFAVPMTFYVLALVKRIEWLVYVAGALNFCVLCFMCIMYLIPAYLYNRFLKDMKNGLSRAITGTIAEIGADVEVQDGVRVKYVRVDLDDEDDDRFVYLNVSKQEGFPKEGSHVTMKCYGRHIVEVVE